MKNLPSCLTSVSLNSPLEHVDNREGCVQSEMACTGAVRTQENTTQDIRNGVHCPVNELSQGPCALHSGCAVTSHLSRRLTISTISDRMFQQSWLWGTARSTKASESLNNGSNTCLHACVFYCILNLFEKMYDAYLAVFLHVYFSRFNFCCQKWKLLFLPAQHSSLPSLKTTPQFPFRHQPHPQPSYTVHVVHMRLTPHIHTA